jgi:hypothetical protein
VPPAAPALRAAALAGHPHGAPRPPRPHQAHQRLAQLYGGIACGAGAEGEWGGHGVRVGVKQDQNDGGGGQVCWAVPGGEGETGVLKE